MQYSISDKRALKQEEIQLLNYLFTTSKPEWIALISKLKVIARCGCGKCPTILFGETFESEIQKGELLFDYVGEGPNREKIGVSLFGTDRMPTELEFYSIDGESDVIEIPKTDTLRPLN